MLSKLLKYDLKYMIKNMSIFYILSIVFAILTRIFFSLEQTVVINVIGQICVGCMFSMIASILINTMMRSWVRFKDSVYGDESYLTHTLPASKKSIYESKFIQTVIFLLVGFVVILISLFIAYYTKDRLVLLKDTIDNIANGLNLYTPLFIISIVLILFLEILNGIQSGLLGIILGYKQSNAKVGYSVLFGFIAYSISQTIVLICIFIYGLFNNSIGSLFTSNIIMDVSIFKTISILATITYSLVIILMNIASVLILKKGVNVE